MASDLENRKQEVRPEHVSEQPYLDALKTNEDENPSADKMVRFAQAIDAAPAKQGIPVSVGVTGVTSVSYYDVEAGTTTGLNFSEADGRTSFTVPSLTVWGVVVLHLM